MAREDADIDGVATAAAARVDETDGTGPPGDSPLVTLGGVVAVGTLRRVTHRSPPNPGGVLGVVSTARAGDGGPNVTSPPNVGWGVVIRLEGETEVEGDDVVVQFRRCLRAASTSLLARAS